MIKDTKTNNCLNAIARWFVGLVFLFSSFFKGVDPMGTAFKIGDYIQVWSGSAISFEWAAPFAPVFSMLLIVAEFVVGFLLVTNSFRKLSAWLLLLMMLFFTGTTAVDAFSANYGIDDCGCFGDAIKLTPLQTFLKNVVLLVPTIWIFLTRKLHYRHRFERDAFNTILAVVLMSVFGIYNICNEPIIDFRPWKVGNKMMNTDSDLQVESYVSYRDNATGEVVEVPAVECASYAEDTVAWTWVSSRVVDPYEINAPGFSMLDLENEDWASDIIASPEPLLIATIYQLEKMDDDCVEDLLSVVRASEENGIQLVLLSSALPEEMQSFMYDHEISNLDFYFADATAIKTILRSNPGFILLRDAKVLGKWHHRHADQCIEAISTIVAEE